MEGVARETGSGNSGNESDGVSGELWWWLGMVVNRKSREQGIVRVHYISWENL